MAGEKNGIKGSKLPSEKPERQKYVSPHQRVFDTDVADVNSYKERQDSYMGELNVDPETNEATNPDEFNGRSRGGDIGDDPGTFEN